MGKVEGGGSFDLRDTKVLCEHVCVRVCVRVEGGGALGPSSYQENGAKETEAGDRKLEEEAAPIVPAQYGSYNNRQPGGKLAQRLRV